MDIETQQDLAAGLWAPAPAEVVAAGLWTLAPAEVPKKRYGNWKQDELDILYRYRQYNCTRPWKKVAQEVNLLLGGTNFSKSSMENQYKRICLKMLMSGSVSAPRPGGDNGDGGLPMFDSVASGGDNGDGDGDGCLPMFDEFAWPGSP